MSSSPWSQRRSSPRHVGSISSEALGALAGVPLLNLRLKFGPVPSERVLAGQGLDAFLVPTTPLPATPLNNDDVVMLNGRLVERFVYTRNTSPAASAAVPALSLPAGLTADGLPVGIMLIGRVGCDLRLLEIGIALEQMLDPIRAPSHSLCECGIACR